MIVSPTPDFGITSATSDIAPHGYVVKNSDTLDEIARANGLSVELLMQTNGLTDPNVLSVGQVLTIPDIQPAVSGSGFKIIPNSELVYGPMSILLDIQQYVAVCNGYLNTYDEVVEGELLSGVDIVLRVARNYSINPRLLLAIIEYRSGWVTLAEPDVETLVTPLGLADGWHDGLYRQLTWAANLLNSGYYLWRVRAVEYWTLADGTRVPAVTGINAGTAGVQAFFAGLDDYNAWSLDVSERGLYATFYAMFGYPFNLAIEPIVPEQLVQPVMQLPFEPGVSWAFTGGPHGGWDFGSAWAALDFAPSGTEGCVTSEAWVVAVADGLVVRSENGVVVLDLDSDGYEQTGWTVLYLHIEDRGRVPVGTYLDAGDKIGHPSCEGGVAEATHLHLARRINGEWIPADGLVPFDLDGWISSGTGVEYDGYLTRGGTILEAYNGTVETNEIHR